MKRIKYQLHNFLPYGKILGWEKYPNRKLLVFFLATGLLFFGGCGWKPDQRPPDNSFQAKIKATKQDPKEVSVRGTVKILFVGDMMFDRYIRQSVERHGDDYEYIFLGIKDELSKYDLVVGNLEGPITDKESVSVGTAMDEKKNLVFSFDPAVAKTLAASDIKLVNIGNNHILNQGEEGLTETKKNLDAAGVQYFGDADANEQGDVLKTIGGTKVGIVNYNYSEAGSFEKALEDISTLKGHADILVAYPHWGTEYKSGDPGQEIRKEAYKLIDAGADLIIGTHPHVVQTSEIYHDKKIYYSLGNFIFDQYFQKETRQGMGVELTIDPDLKMEFRDLKFVMNKNGQTIIGP